ncbi:MAG: hypothetical protein H7069_05405 [Phormidesmis sp. FL-bin-119]|nr:hypothetical protein [Pedobacter sp.]
MLVHVKNLSIWEIAHYWHDCDPRETGTHSLPLNVRDTLLVLATSYSKKLFLRVDKEKLFMLDVYNKSARLTGRHYRHTFKKAIDNKVFGKRFFSNMFITRSQLAHWCIDHKESMPKFWFPDNEKFPYETKDKLTDEITVGGRYKLVLLYDYSDKPKIDLEKLTNSGAATVNENAIKAANAKHASTNALKSNFYNFYLSNADQFASKVDSARKFFNSLTSKERLLFTNEETATRTFTDGLRKFLKTR